MQWEFSSGLFFFPFSQGLGRFDPVLHFDCSSLLHKWDSSRPTSPICCFLMLFSSFFLFYLKASDTQRHKSTWNTTDQNKHQLVKSPWNWMSIMQHKMQKYFKPFFGDSARHSLLWLSRHVQRLMSCSQRTKFNEWDQCVLICCSVSGHCTLSRGRSLSNHILTRQLPWKRKRWRMWANERLESHGVEESCSMTVMIRIEFVLGGAVHSKDVCLAARTFETSLA